MATPEPRKTYILCDPARVAPVEVPPMWPPALLDFVGRNGTLDWQTGDAIYVVTKTDAGTIDLPDGATAKMSEWFICAVVIRRGQRWHTLEFQTHAIADAFKETCDEDAN